ALAGYRPATAAKALPLWAGLRLHQLHRDYHRLLAFLHVRPFGLHQHLLWPLLTSARASRHLSMPVAQGTHADLPGYDTPTFTLMPVGSTAQCSVQVPGFGNFGYLAPL